MFSEFRFHTLYLFLLVNILFSMYEAERINCLRKRTSILCQSFWKLRPPHASFNSRPQLIKRTLPTKILVFSIFLECVRTYGMPLRRRDGLYLSGASCELLDLYTEPQNTLPVVFPLRIHLNIRVIATHSVRTYGMAFNSDVNLAKTRRWHNNVLPYLQIFRRSDGK